MKPVHRRFKGYVVDDNDLDSPQALLAGTAKRPTPDMPACPQVGMRVPPKGAIGCLYYRKTTMTAR